MESLSELLLLPEICVQFLSLQFIQSAKGSVQIDAEQFHCRTFPWSIPNYMQQSMHKLCNFTFKQASQLLNCKYVQKPFRTVSSDLSMLQMDHWSHVQLVLVHSPKWSECVLRSDRFIRDSTPILLYCTLEWEKRNITQSYYHYSLNKCKFRDLSSIAMGRWRSFYEGERMEKTTNGQQLEWSCCMPLCPSSTILTAASQTLSCTPQFC